MWIDNNGCQEFHRLGKDENNKWIAVHIDDSACESVEFGGDMEERIKVAVPDMEKAERIKRAEAA